VESQKFSEEFPNEISGAPLVGDGHIGHPELEIFRDLFAQACNWSTIASGSSGGCRKRVSIVGSAQGRELRQCLLVEVEDQYCFLAQAEV
jgi:hypothetical protein